MVNNTMVYYEFYYIFNEFMERVIIEEIKERFKIIYRDKFFLEQFDKTYYQWNSVIDLYEGHNDTYPTREACWQACIEFSNKYPHYEFKYRIDYYID